MRLSGLGEGEGRDDLTRAKYLHGGSSAGSSVEGVGAVALRGGSDGGGPRRGAGRANVEARPHAALIDARTGRLESPDRRSAPNAAEIERGTRCAVAPARPALLDQDPEATASSGHPEVGSLAQVFTTAALEAKTDGELTKHMEKVAEHRGTAAPMGQVFRALGWNLPGWTAGRAQGDGRRARRALARGDEPDRRPGPGRGTSGPSAGAR
jgi:hypothetical protein